MPSPTVVLFDAMNLIRRVYAAQSQQNTTDQKALANTLSQCLSILSSIINDTNASHAALIFDSSVPTWRHDLYPDYKAHRSPMPGPLEKQLPAFMDACKKAGIPLYWQPGFEADDLIASAAKAVAPFSERVWVISTDKGLLQILTHNCKVRSHFERKTWETEDILDEYGVNQDQLIDYWTLVGDTTNNVPGLTGVGKKTAAQLLQLYGNLEGIAANIVSLPERIHQNLKSEAIQMLTSRLLVALKTNIPLRCNLSDWRIHGVNLPTRYEIESIFGSNIMEQV